MRSKNNQPPVSIEEPGAGLKGSAFGITFQENKTLPVHGWYPYVEGFSSTYVKNAIQRYGEKPGLIYDPFGGSGTTQLTACWLGIRSAYSEINPFMRFVTDTKINSAGWAQLNLKKTQIAFNEFTARLSSPTFLNETNSVSLDSYDLAFPNRDFFEDAHIRQFVLASRLANEVAGRNRHIAQLLQLACASNLVACSNMTRRADLRRRRADEYKGRVVDVAASISASAVQMLRDLSSIPSNLATTELVSEDARILPKPITQTFDFAITSPPYLNGTNYFRNTKIELWFLGFIESENQLAGFRSQTVCGGINDVGGGRRQPSPIPDVAKVTELLKVSALDSRIPKMVAYYFDDMARVLSEVHRGLKKGGRFVLDIGDSCFYGVHVPTDKLLIEVGRLAGFEIEAHNILARRYSRSDVQLTQSEIIFRKSNNRRAPKTKLIDSSHT